MAPSGAFLLGVPMIIKELTGKRIAELLNNIITINWEKGWKSNIRATQPYNPISGTVYQGANRINLYQACLNDYETRELRFATEKQIKKAGGKLKTWAQPYTINYFTGTAIRQYTVYSYNDVIIDNKDEYAIKDYKFSRNRMDKLIKKLNIDIKIAKDLQPSYAPYENTVYMVSNTNSWKEKYEALFHEIAHWTKYNFPVLHRNYPYPEEEIVAELAAWMVCEDFFKISETRQKMKLNYIESWLSCFPSEMKTAVMDEAYDMAYKVYTKIMEYYDDTGC